MMIQHELRDVVSALRVASLALEEGKGFDHAERVVFDYTKQLQRSDEVHDALVGVLEAIRPLIQREE